MKRCTLCKKDKVLKSFNKNKHRKDGLSNICKDCSKKHSKEYYKKNHEKMILQISVSKKNRVLENRKKVYDYFLKHPCIDCKESDPIVLEFDHIKGNKVENVSKLIADGFSWDIIEIEIKKCDVRCANCHRRKTAKQFNHHSYTFVA